MTEKEERATGDPDPNDTELSIEERIWLLQFRAIVDLIGATVLGSPDAADAKRRFNAIRDEMSHLEKCYGLKT